MIALAEIDRVLARAVEAGEVPGVVALAADAHGVVYQGAAGQRRLPDPGDRAPGAGRRVPSGRGGAACGGGLAMALDTVVRIASMTKAVTAVAALQLVERGRVGLEEPLAAHLPEIAAVQVLDGFDAAGAPRLRPPRRAIALRHLLTHTAGFAYPIWNADLLRLEQRRGSAVGPLTAPLVFDPGDRWEYGIGLDWAGRLVERLSGQSLEDYLRHHVFDRLGMPDTGFALRPDQRARQASRHQRQPDGSLRPLPLESAQPPAFFNGGGGLYSTGPDYLRFLRMLLGGGELDGARVLRPDTVAQMARNQIGDLTVGVMRSYVPERSNDAEFFPGMVKRWGLGGLVTTEDAPTGRSAGSWAWAGLNNTYFWIDPARRVAGLVLTQILPFCDAPALQLFDRFERAVYG